MRPAHVLIACAFLLTGALAGCIGGTDAGPSGDAANANDTTTDAATTGNASASKRSHVHDRWDGRTEVTLFDGTVQTRSTTDLDPSQDLFDNVVCAAFTCASGVTFGPAEDEIVPPGTDRVTVDASWEEDAAATAPGVTNEVFFGYRAANMGGIAVLGTSPNGSWTINTTTEMADGGHAKVSLWMFGFYVTRTVDGVGRLPRHSVQPFAIDVAVTAHRVQGELPLEPPHPDWWTDSSRTLYNVSQSGNAYGGTYFSGTVDGNYPADWVNGTEHGVVPPGTQTLVVEITWNNTSPASAAATPRPYAYWLNTFTFEDDLTRWEPATLEEGRAVYEMKLTEGMTDGMYSERSRWRFLWYFRGQDTGASDPLFGQETTGPYHLDGEWSVEITAHPTIDVSVPGV